MDTILQNSEINRGGPQTPEGKAVSRFNALKHGLLSKETVIDGEDSKAFNDFIDDMKQHINPIGPLEELLVDRIISSFWRLRRAVSAEKATMEWTKNFEKMELDFGLNSSEKQKSREIMKNLIENETIEKILRYETTIERGIFKALHELERIQAKRNGEKTQLPMALDVMVDGIDDMSSFRKNS